MFKSIKKTTKGLVRGTSSAVLISIAIHAAILFGAGALVVFTVVKNREARFVPPPPIERPKMKLVRPRVKVKKNVNPGAVKRISAKAVASMPDIQLPEISGAGSGLSGGVGGFELAPDLTKMSVFGGTKSMSVGNDFEGTFYSFAYDRRGQKTTMTEAQYVTLLRKFMDAGWNPYVFAPYYRGPQKLYASQIFIPTIFSEYGPSHFGIPAGPDFDPYLWCVHYKGKIMSPDKEKKRRFRFWGMGDDILLVRVNGELVFNGSWDYWRNDLSDWRPDSKDDSTYWLGHAQALVGHWFELDPGEPVEMEVLIGEIPGGHFCAYLMVEEEGEEYDENRDGMPVLPVFKTAEIPDIVKDQIKYTLIRGEADLDSPLMFNVY